eukprot:GHVT01104598.1.p2 GENE.GHVT01104598.1~~GHVT01104598.1.p2  ORF type:complete len:102 (-),score=9.72 GHVT01104598.1:99-404(-)
MRLGSCSLCVLSPCLETRTEEFTRSFYQEVDSVVGHAIVDPTDVYHRRPPLVETISKNNSEKTTLMIRNLPNLANQNGQEPGAKRIRRQILFCINSDELEL